MLEDGRVVARQVKTAEMLYSKAMTESSFPPCTFSSSCTCFLFCFSARKSHLIWREGVLDWVLATWLLRLCLAPGFVGFASFHSFPYMTTWFQ